MKNIYQYLAKIISCIVLITSINPIVAADTINLIVPFSVGGAADQLARILQPELADKLEKTVVVNYQLGAGGEVAAASLARNNNTQITLLLHSIAFAIQNSEYNPNYNWQTDFKFVAWLGHVPLVLVANNQWPYTGLSQLHSELPKSFTYGSSGVNTSTHYNGALLGLYLNQEFVHVPYKGAGAVIPNLIGNHIDLAFSFFSTVKPYIETQQLIPLAVLNDRRLKQLPHIPTLHELGIDQPWLHTWLVLLANKNANQTELDQIQSALERILQKPNIQKTLEENGHVIHANKVNTAKSMIINEISRVSGVRKTIQNPR